MKKIFQYDDPKVVDSVHDLCRDGAIRWIAADSAALADAYALQHGWDRCGGEKFVGSKTVGACVTTDDYIDFGCDVVL